MARTRIGVVPRPPVWQYLSLVNFLAHHPGRRWSVASAALAGVWALFLLPPQLVEWGDAPAWAEALNDSPFYRGVDALRETLGLHDAYVASGSAIALSVVLVWWATGPSLRWLGWSGHVFSWVLLSLAPVTVLSYASYKETSPLHALWGAEALVLIALGVVGIVVAIVTRAPGVRPWLRVLIGATVLIEAVFTVLFTYYPHGTLIGLALQAGVMGAFAPRAEIGADGQPGRQPATA